jgi:hypothetical protein
LDEDAGKTKKEKLTKNNDNAHKQWQQATLLLDDRTSMPGPKMIRSTWLLLLSDEIHYAEMLKCVIYYIFMFATIMF